MRETRRRPPSREEIESFTRSGIEWIMRLLARAVSLFRLVLLVSIVLAVAAVLLGLAAVNSDARIGFLVVGGALAAVPVAVAWWAFHGVKTVAVTGPQMVKDMHDAARDPAVWGRIITAVRNDESGQTSKFRRFRTNASDVMSLRRATWGRKGEFLSLGAAAASLARVPFALLVVAIGWLVLAAWCAICLAVVVFS